MSHLGEQTFNRVENILFGEPEEDLRRNIEQVRQLEINPNIIIWLYGQPGDMPSVIIFEQATTLDQIYERINSEYNIPDRDRFYMKKINRDNTNIPNAYAFDLRDAIPVPGEYRIDLGSGKLINLRK